MKPQRGMLELPTTSDALSTVVSRAWSVEMFMRRFGARGSHEAEPLS